MKKWISGMLILAMFLLTACTGTMSGKDPGPPEPISFKSEFELVKMMNAVERGEEAFAGFLKEYPQFAGSVSISEMKLFRQKLETVGYPAIDGEQPVESFTMTYYAHDSSPMDYQTVYRMDGVRYRFAFYENKEEESRVGQVPVGTYEIDGETVALYQGTDNLVGEIYKNDYQIRITVSNYNSVNDISLESFRWNYDVNLPPPTGMLRNNNRTYIEIAFFRKPEVWLCANRKRIILF